VAAFLLNVVVTRLLATQCEQIAALKAFGYSNGTLAVHFTKLVLAIVIVGWMLGSLGGRWLRHGLAAMYMKFYHFPYLDYGVAPWLLGVAAAVAITAALLGTLHAVWRAASLPPAEAMRPEPPASYRVSWVERLGLQRWLHQPTRMIIRNLERRPIKSLFAILGMAFSCAILVLGAFFGEAVEHMVQVQLRIASREDTTVTFIEPTSRKALFELERLQDVDRGEPFRTVPVRIRAGHRTYRTAVEGLEPGCTLARRLDEDLEVLEVPAEGVMLSEYLGAWLGVAEGDSVTIEALEGTRSIAEVPVARLIRDYIGINATMSLTALNRLMDEGPAISGVRLATGGRFDPALFDEIEERPRVAATTIRRNIIRNFNETMAEQVLTFSFFNTLLAMSIAFGVVYNSARISLSERSRELASLRVLGFRRGEIAYILLGELAVLTLSGIVIGFGVGWLLGAFLIQKMQTDLFRIPLIIDPGTYAFAATVVLVSAIISSIIVKHMLDRLDLVAVLKTRE
ncbi:MAG: ABC transporter permease, partial [Planctomycetota bacterium]